MIILSIYFKWGKNLFATNFSCVLLPHNDWKRPAAREYFWNCSLGLRRLDLHKDFSVFPPTDGVLGYHLHERTQSVCSLAENWCYSVYPVLSMPHPFLWKVIPLSLPSHCPPRTSELSSYFIKTLKESFIFGELVIWHHTLFGDEFEILCVYHCVEHYWDITKYQEPTESSSADFLQGFS